VLTELELLPPDQLIIPGYEQYMASLSSTDRIRLGIFVKKQLGPQVKVLATSPMDVWIRLHQTGLTIAGVYRQWTGSNELTALTDFHTRCEAFSKVNKIFICGDFNLAYGRESDSTYFRRQLNQGHLQTMSRLGFEYVGPFAPTYFSHGSYKGEQRCSILDHGYAVGIPGVTAEVLGEAFTDNRPVWFNLPKVASTRGESSILHTHSFTEGCSNVELL